RKQLWQPDRHPGILAEREKAVDRRNHQQHMQICCPLIERKREYQRGSEEDHYDRLASETVSQEAKADIAADSAEVVAHAGIARPCLRRESGLARGGSNERWHPC